MIIEVSEYAKKYHIIEVAAQKANRILAGRDSEFRDKVSSIKSFTYSIDDGDDVLHKMITSQSTMRVYLYKTRNPWSRVLGYTRGKDIYINERNIHRSISSIVETFVHEAMHIVGYSHGGNAVRWYNRNKKMNSVPYKVGRIAGEV